LQSAEIRRRFIEFFKARGHQAVPSSSLIPDNDPTLFFVNAGMVQFKNVFTGQESRAYRRATSTQKCLRVSGKHNDLENVGHTSRHHTFFEMLGNFSFGDYFKADAIVWAWEFLTQELGIDGDRLWITVHESDDEAYAIWRDEVGVPEERVQRLGDKDNFWTMGDTGPCGPCAEIHYDMGPTVSDNLEGPVGEDDRYVEIWNLVFMQFQRDDEGNQTPLPKPSIDTGAGLERLAAVMQGVTNNFETDCFAPIMATAAELAGVRIGEDATVDTALQVIADHARATAFLIADGVMPSNEERGYVLRRIMRRAIRYGVKIGLEEPFFWRAVDSVVEHLGEAFTELKDRQSFISEIVHAEEARFAQTLDKGLGLLQNAIDALGDENRVLDGGVVFRLHDTFGFPPDLTGLIAGEQGVIIDELGYRRAMGHQRALGRAAWKGSGEQTVADVYRQLAASHPTKFVGYELGREDSEIIALVKNGQLVQGLGEDESGVVITLATPFYGESGGQVGDTGLLTTDNGRATIADTRKPLPNLIAHHVHVTAGNVLLSEAVSLEVDTGRRRTTRRNHTATHLLHAALKQVLGYHVAQKGSLVGPGRLRFDFSHHRPMTRDDIASIEDLVYRQVLANTLLQVQEMPIDEARALGAEALFGEKYGDVVRVITVPDFSIELCGGTHVRATGDIGLFKIISETGIAAGVRRIEAQTGFDALRWVRAQEEIVHEVSASLKAAPGQILEQIQRLQTDRKRFERALEDVRRDAARDASASLVDQSRTVGDIEVLAAELPGDASTLREEAERLRDQLGERAVVVLAARADGGVTLVATASKAIAGKPIHAGNLIRSIAQQVGGGGGGRPDMAQAGGKQPEKLLEALESVYTWVASQQV
jgi:alanyl-tRNA synthetase